MGASVRGTSLLEPGVSSESQVGVDGVDKTTTDRTAGHLTESACVLMEQIVAQFMKTDLNKTVPQKLFEIGGDDEKVLLEEGTGN